MKAKEYKYFTKAVPLPDGRRKYIRAKTKRELEKKVLEFMIAQAMEKERVIVSSDMTVQQLGDLWLEKVKRPSVRPQTFMVYEDRLRLHVYPAIGDMRVQDVRLIHIIDIVNAHGFATKEANRGLLSAIRALFRFAVENEIIRKSPADSRIPVTGAPTREEKPLTPTQTQALLDYTRQQKDPNVYMFTLLALVTGMRCGELSALRWDCVDLQNGEIHVRRQMVTSTGEITEDLKTRASRRSIPISAEVISLLRSVHASSSSVYVLAEPDGDHINAASLKRYSKIWNRAGVTGGAVHAHLFRKTFATRLIETGADPKRVQYLLGHETLEMTLSVYALYDRETQVENTRGLLTDTFSSYVSA